MDRKIYLVGDIDHDSYLRFTRKLTRLEAESDTPIHIVLCSDGGDAMIALAFHDRIKMSHLYDSISICAIGLVASAAVLILAACKTRQMTSSSWVMVHDDTPPSFEVKHKRLTHLEKTTQHYRRVENQWNSLLEACTGTDSSVWDILHQNETYLTVGECLDYNLIQEII